MSDFAKALEGMKATIAAIKATVDAGNPNKEAMEKELQKRMDTLQAAMVANVRKGVYAQDRKGEQPEDGILFSKGDDKAEAFKEWNDNCLLVSALAKKSVRSLKMFEKRAAGVSELKKAMDSETAGEGYEWIPTDFSSDLYERVRLALKVAALFPEIQMPTDPYKLPTQTVDATAYLTSENTGDTPTKITASTPTTGNVQLDAKKIAARVVFSNELTEDSIIPVLEFLKNNIATAIATGIEKGIISGDTSSTHMDADTTGSTDVRKAWDGLRHAAVYAGTLTATPTIAELRAVRAKMGKYGLDPRKIVWLVSAAGYLKLLTVTEFLTPDKYGVNATILSGELGKIDGAPVIVSSEMRDDLNATGFNDATTNTKGQLLCIYTPAWIRGVKRGLKVRLWDDVETDTQSVVATWRGALVSYLTVTTEYVVSKACNWTV